MEKKFCSWISKHFLVNEQKIVASLCVVEFSNILYCSYSNLFEIRDLSLNFVIFLFQFDHFRLMFVLSFRKIFFGFFESLLDCQTSKSFSCLGRFLLKNCFQMITSKSWISNLIFWCKRFCRGKILGLNGISILNFESRGIF